jgi:hypothetical protein
MPTISATGTLSARLRIAQGGRPGEVVDVSEKPANPLPDPKHCDGEKPLCSWSVMAGQRCNRVAVVGDTLCRSHLAMMGTPLAPPTSPSRRRPATRGLAS